MCLIFLLNDLACFSFSSAAAAEPVQQSLQKNLNPHRGSGQADIDEGQIESGNKNGGYFFAQRVQSFCHEPAMKWVTGAARARFLAAFGRSKAVPPEAGAFMTSVTPSQPEPSDRACRWDIPTAMDRNVHVTSKSPVKAVQLFELNPRNIDILTVCK